MKKEKYRVEVEKLITGGQGLSRLEDGLVVLVPFVLPGEIVDIEILAKKKQYALAKLVNIVEPSPLRITPECNYYSKCGGCDLQHTSYNDQLDLKHEYFFETLTRSLPHGALDKSQYNEILPSPHQFNYRQRIRLQKDPLGCLGFYAKASHDIIDIESCPLAQKEINTVLSEIKGKIDHYSVLDQTNSIELLFSPEDTSILVILHVSRKARPADKASAKQLCQGVDLVKSVWILADGFALEGPFVGSDNATGLNVNLVKFKVQPSSNYKKLDFSMEAQGFCQVNLGQNEQLIGGLLTWLKESKIAGRVLDLFCGMGNFSLPLAQAGYDVVGMDVQRAAIRSALKNAQANEIKNCSFAQYDAQNAVQKLLRTNEHFDLILLDPPRQGCMKIISSLSSFNAPYIVYISCDPATLARDMTELVESGYSIEKCQGVDMFPQTHHVESVTLLRKVAQ